MCIYIYIYAHVCICMYIYIYTHAYVYVYTIYLLVCYLIIHIMIISSKYDPYYVIVNIGGRANLSTKNCPC